MKDKKIRISEKKVIYQPQVKQTTKTSLLSSSSSSSSSSVNTISQTYIHSETGKKIKRIQAGSSTHPKVSPPSAHQDEQPDSLSSISKEESENEKNPQEENPKPRRNRVNLSRQHSVTALSNGQTNLEGEVVGKRKRRKRITLKMKKNNLEWGVE